MNHDPELEQSLAQFMGAFELVFDHDWDHTRGCLKNPDDYIDANGTFLNPGQFDEGNNWGNRYGLLESYRKLVEVMLSRGIRPAMPE